MRVLYCTYSMCKLVFISLKGCSLVRNCSFESTAGYIYAYLPIRVEKCKHKGGGGINEEKVDGDVVGGGKGEIDYMHMHLVDLCAQ